MQNTAHDIASVINPDDGDGCIFAAIGTTRQEFNAALNAALNKQ